MKTNSNFLKYIVFNSETHSFLSKNNTWKENIEEALFFDTISEAEKFKDLNNQNENVFQYIPPYLIESYSEKGIIYLKRAVTKI